MLLGFFSLLIAFAVGYAYYREGTFTAFAMLFNTVVAGLVAFNFFEPLADFLELYIAGTWLAGVEDTVSLVALFSLTLGLLRMATNSLAPTDMIYPDAIHRGGGFLFGAINGYLVAGFLICALQTLPWHENFMFFDHRYEPGGGLRRFVPPDRVWLAMMFRAGAYPFANNEDPNPPENIQSQADRYLTFDKYGTFEARYALYRRYADNREAQIYAGQFDQELGKQF